MTDAEKITMFRVLTDENDVTEVPDTVVAVYLDLASDAIKSRRYPFGVPTVDGVPVDATLGYEKLQVRLASRYWQRRGAEGETAHNESGVNRTYGSVNDEDLLSEVIQVIGV